MIFLLIIGIIRYSEAFMKKRLFYIFSILLLLLTFNVFYFIGKSNYKQKNIDNINTNITEEDLLETARLQLHSLQKHHHQNNDIDDNCVEPNEKYNKILHQIF